MAPPQGSAKPSAPQPTTTSSPPVASPPIPHSPTLPSTACAELHPSALDSLRRIDNLLPSPGTRSKLNFHFRSHQLHNLELYKRFQRFQAAVEYFEGPHSPAHEIVGGDLGGYRLENANEVCFATEPSPTFSTNEPMFWFHHAVSPSPIFQTKNY